MNQYKTPRRDDWLDAAAACRVLDVTRATLYAYVSRGFVRSQPAPGAPRQRRYAREDVERLRRRAEERRDPDQAAARALQWGMPILESSIAFIDGTRLFYRGHDAVELSRHRSVEEVASLVWTGQFDRRLTTPGEPRAPGDPAAPRSAVGPSDSVPLRDPVASVLKRKAHPSRQISRLQPEATGVHLPIDPDAPGTRQDDAVGFVPRAQTRLVSAAARDSLAYDLRPDAVARTGWQILMLMTVAATGVGTPVLTIDRALADAWQVRGRGIDLLRAALILCADHELNVSAFTARCVASAGSTPYAVVVAGLAALEGTRHGGMSARVEAQLDSWRRARSLRQALADRLRRGEPIDGFGHPLYRRGDPRAAALLEALRESYPRSRELRLVLDVAEAAEATVGEQPTVDFALAAVARVLRLPPGSPLVLFAIGRSIGWIGHAMEQYATGQLIRPRAKYVGPPPRESPPDGRDRRPT